MTEASDAATTESVPEPIAEPTLAPEPESVAEPPPAPKPEPTAEPVSTSPRVSVSRELILPGIRLDLPARPSEQQIAALAEHSSEQWTTAPSDWVTQQVVRLAIAALLTARLEPRPGVASRHPLPSDPAAVTLAELATLFRPHVDLSAQAFELAVVESVNAGVPAAVDPVRDGLRRVGVTGRDPIRVVALGLDKLPPRARQAFWEGVRTSDTVTAVVDAVSSRRPGEHGRPHDVSGLDRSQLARADALAVAGGRTTPLGFSSRASAGGSWVDIPLGVVRREREAARRPDRGPDHGVEVRLGGEGWTDAFETALDAVSTAMRQLDLGTKPKGGLRGLSAALVQRLVAAGGRTVADVCGSLRDLEPTALALFDHQVVTTHVPVAVPVVDDELFVQLWLPTSALAGPLVTGSADLFLGGPAQVRSADGGRDAGRDGGRGESGRGARDGRRGRPGRGRDGATPPGRDTAPGGGDRPTAEPGGGGRSSRKRRGGRGGAAASPSTEAVPTRGASVVTTADPTSSTQPAASSAPVD